MKKLIVAVMTLSVLMMGCGKSDNPLLVNEFETPFATPPFELIKLEHYMPAFDEGIAQNRAEIEQIANNTDEPTFENTIEALERSGALLSRIAQIFYPLTSSETSPEMEKLSTELQPKLTALSNDISLNPKLFERVAAVYNQRATVSTYTPEQRTLLENCYKGFSRSGAALNDEDKAKYREITTELSGIQLKFGQNVLAHTNAFQLNIPLADSLKVNYMPDFVRAAMAEEAKAKGLEGWVVTLQAPSFGPFMTYSKERDIKESLWREYNTRCYGGEFDNREIVKRIAELRLELAKVLGYKTYADYALEERMAENVDNVNKLLNELLVSTHNYAMLDYKDIEEYAATLADSPKKIMPWDWAYYTEKFQTEKYSLNQEIVKPYFQLDNVEKGTFMLAEKLFGITFKENKEIGKYHSDVKVFEVYEENGDFLSILYMDYFPRAGKSAGAWMTSFRDMSTTASGEEVRPFITLNFNFTKPIGDTPALLTFLELTTVLHEFGHGLHGMLAKGTYSSLTGTSVYRDFVELPSQILENWATEKEWLDMWAVHYQTGEKIPAELVEKIKVSRGFLASYGNTRQLMFGINDMAWHSITEPVTEDVGAFERRVTASTQVLPAIENTCFTTAFTHVFGGGYAAGYYSYKWAEVLEADAFQLFKEKGIFNREVANSFRKNILEKGGSEHPMKLYMGFRGHQPETKPLVDKMIGNRK